VTPPFVCLRPRNWQISCGNSFPVAGSVLRCVKRTDRDHHNMDEPTAPTDPLRWSRGRTRRAAAELVNEAESLCRGAHPARVRRERDQLGEAIGCSEVTSAAQRLRGKLTDEPVLWVCCAAGLVLAWFGIATGVWAVAALGLVMHVTAMWLVVIRPQSPPT
jgi:hypothetical protein